MFLLDTDALSEFEKPSPDAGFLAWLENADWLELHLSVITVGELWKGIVALPGGRKRRALEAMFAILPERFYNRIVPVDYAIALKFGEAGPFGRDALMASGLVLFVITLLVNGAARLIIARRKEYSGANA